MLVTRMEKWMEQWKQETAQQFRLEGEQQGEERGEQRGRQKGEQKGRQQGEAAFLLRLLERRFGAVPDWARDRVLAADTATMEEWGLRVLDAATLEEVLA